MVITVRVATRQVTGRESVNLLCNRRFSSVMLWQMRTARQRSGCNGLTRAWSTIINAIHNRASAGMEAADSPRSLNTPPNRAFVSRAYPFRVHFSARFFGVAPIIHRACEYYTSRDGPGPLIPPRLFAFFARDARKTTATRGRKRNRSRPSGQRSTLLPFSSRSPELDVPRWKWTILLRHDFMRPSLRRN